MDKISLGIFYYFVCRLLIALQPPLEGSTSFGYTFPLVNRNHAFSITE